MSINKTFTVDQFLGLHEADHGSTELKLGEASVMENFYITDEYNLKTRSGVKALQNLPGKIHTVHPVYFHNKKKLLILCEDGGTAGTLAMYLLDAERNFATVWAGEVTTLRSDRPVKVFALRNNTYVVGCHSVNEDQNLLRALVVSEEGTSAGISIEIYTPLIYTGCAPSGGGEELESVNLMNPVVRIQFSGDGTSSDYVLPVKTHAVLKIMVDGQEVAMDGPIEHDHNVYRHNTPFPKGVNNVEFLCDIDNDELKAAREKFLNMRHCEAFNGATDTRFFFYGDGTNVCYYSGVPAYGSGLYIPAGSEIAVDASSSPITGMRRHYTRLMAFKPDGAFTIDYEPVTLTDGRIKAGFYVRPASRSIGSDMDNQIQTVNNYPRTFCNGALYEWKHTASYYQDERYAKRIGDNVARSLASADPTKIVTCDDESSGDYYLFLNDEKGTVLVNRYNLDVWCLYTGEVFSGVSQAAAVNGTVYLARNTQLLKLDRDSVYDYFIADQGAGSVWQPIAARWESGYHPFAADYKRKYSSYLWISVLPEIASRMEVTVKTDRRDEYLTKTVGNPLFTWENMDFSNFSFLLSTAPRMRRIKIKVKKFVYYKLIFTVTHPGARATVLGYDQQVRYSSNVK